MTDKTEKQAKTVALLGGQSMGFSPEYRRDAEALGVLLGQNGFDVVYDGGMAGLAGVAAKAALENGSQVTGIVTAAFRKAADYVPLAGADEIIARTGPSRRARMMEQADAWLVLPGGAGVQREQWNILMQLDGQIATRSPEVVKPVLILDTNGFYQPLKAQLRQLTREGFMLPGRGATIRFAEKPAQLIAGLTAWTKDGPRHAGQIADAYAPQIAKVMRDLKCG